MSFDGFIKFPLGIKGASTEKDHGGSDGWSGLLGFDFGVDLPTLRQSKSGGSTTSERANFKDITVTKEVDCASPKLLEALASGAVFETVQIDLCRPIAKALGSAVFSPYLIITLSQAYLTKVDSFCSATYSRPMEALCFNYGKIKIQYFSYDLKTGVVGSLKPEIEWDCSTNRGTKKS